MARFNLYLLERPRRWTDALRERVRSAATPSSREAVEAFLQGTAEGPVLLAADDNPAQVTALWEQCHRDGLAVCIFDHSTVWDRFRDRLRALRGSPARTSATPAAAPSRAPSPRREETALRDPGAFALGPRARVVVLAVGAFVTLVAVAASVVPEAVREASDGSAQTSDLPGGGGRGSLRASSGQGNAAAARGATQTGLAPGANPEANARDGRDIAAPRAEVTNASGESATESPRAHPARLLAAFAIGVALAWIAGTTLSKRADPAQLRSGGTVLLAFCALVVLTAGVSRLAALSSPTPVEDPPAESPSAEALPETLPEDARAPEALGPFARLLRRHRGLAAPPSRSLRSLLSHWRTSHSDAGDAPDVAAPEPSPARHVDRRHRRHRRHEDRHHARHDTPRAGLSDASTVALADVATDDAPELDAPELDARTDVTATRTATAPSPPVTAPPVTAPPPSREATAATGTPGARTDAPRRPRAVVSRPPPPRRPPPPHSPWAALALGVMVGMLTSPRWRAVAKGAL
jgi:hypothetical protein